MPPPPINGLTFTIFGLTMTSEGLNQPQFDPQIIELIPHRPPMLLINSIQSLDNRTSSARVDVNENVPFFEEGMGVPSWIGLEYMGQTAALIAGYQQRAGLLDPHLGFLLGCKRYEAQVECFAAQANLLVECVQTALVGESLVTFDCTITDINSEQEIALGCLSVFRKATNKK